MKVAMIGLRGLAEGLGGVEKAVREISTRLASQPEVDVTCFCRPRFNQDSDFEGVKLVNIKTVYTKHLETPFYAMGSMIQAARGDYDLIHIHALASSNLAWIPKFFGGKKIVTTIHGLDWQRAKWGPLAAQVLRAGQNAAVKYSDHCICVSRSLQLYLQMHYNSNSFSYIPNGCDPISETTLPAPDGLLSKGYLLFMGRLTPEKGVHHLIEAYRKVQTDHPLVIAGPHHNTEDYYKVLQQLAEGDPRIRFVGSVSGEAKERLLSHAYLFVLPSEIEGLPVALLEAASRGVCPAVSSIPTALEVLGPEAFSAGFTFEVGNPVEMATAIDVALSAPELGISLGHKAREHVLNHFSWDKIAKQTLQVYEKVLN